MELLNSNYVKTMNELWGKSEEFDKLLLSLKQVPTFPSLCSDVLPHFEIDGIALDLYQVRSYFNLKRDFRARPSDIVVASFPKSGTTWLQEIVYLIGSRLNFEEAKCRYLEERFPYMEYPCFRNKIMNLESINEPIRYLKSHLPYHLLPRTIFDNNCKVIYVARNPKDTAVSLYHFYRLISEYSFSGNFGQFLDCFLHNQVIYSPFWKHILSYWERRQDDNILFVKYEDLQKDFINEIKKIATFLDKPVSDAQASQIAHHCSFQSMATNTFTNYRHWEESKVTNKNEGCFMRKGKVGDWKNYFDVELNNKMDDYMKKHFSDCELTFDYHLET